MRARRRALESRPGAGLPALARAAALAIAAVLGACTPGSEPSGDGAAPAPLADQAGAVCGMIVRDQPAPRAQVVHRDGQRAWLCSLGDLLVHLAAPSPHGRPEAVFVEVMAPDADPAARNAGRHPWLPASEASYVVGVSRPGVMGPPVLSYRERTGAERVAARHEGARVLDYDGLQQWWADRQDPES